MDIDFGKTTADYATHRAGYPDKLFAKLERLGVPFEGQHIVDLGTGTGAFARQLARRGGIVTGVDVAPELMRSARELDAIPDVHVDYREAAAEATGLPSQSADVVSAAQAWWWFDRERALAEVKRLSRPAAWFVRVSLDWLPRTGNIVALTEEMILSYNPDWRLAGGNGLHTEWLDEAHEAGFDSIESFSFDTLEPYTHEGWRGRIRASAGVGASLSDQAVAAFDVELAQALAHSFSAEPLNVPHRVYAVIARAPS